MARYKFYASTGFIGAARSEIVEIPDEEIEKLTEREKENYIHDNYFKWWLEENTEIYFYETDEEEEE